VLTLFLVATPGGTVHRVWAARRLDGRRFVDAGAISAFLDGTIFQPLAFVDPMGSKG
jgi:hypothetical protein